MLFNVSTHDIDFIFLCILVFFRIKYALSWSTSNLGPTRKNCKIHRAKAKHRYQTAVGSILAQQAGIPTQWRWRTYRLADHWQLSMDATHAVTDPDIQNVSGTAVLLYEQSINSGVALRLLNVLQARDTGEIKHFSVCTVLPICLIQSKYNYIVVFAMNLWQGDRYTLIRQLIQSHHAGQQHSRYEKQDWT